MALAIQDLDALVALGRTLAARGYRFTTVTPATHRRVNNRPGNDRATDLRGVFGWSRPFSPGLLRGELLGLMHRAGIVEQAGDALRSSVRAATLNGRLYFHSAFPTDGDDAVFFGPDTCRFLSALGRHASAHAPRRIIDIGCGAAPAAIELALRHPDAEVIAADINDTALQLAGANARLAGASRLRTWHSDLLEAVPGQFDLIVSNPPYMLDRGGLAYRDGGSLHGGALSVRLVERALPRLAPGGELLLYTGVAMTGPADPFLEAVRPHLELAHASWHYEELDPDVFGGQLGEPGYEDVERIAAVWLQAQRPGNRLH